MTLQKNEGRRNRRERLVWRGKRTHGEYTERGIGSGWDVVRKDIDRVCYEERDGRSVTERGGERRIEEDRENARRRGGGDEDGGGRERERENKR